MGRVLAQIAFASGFYPVVGEIKNAAQRGGTIQSSLRWTHEPCPIDARIPLGKADVIVCFDSGRVFNFINQFGYCNSTVFVSCEADDERTKNLHMTNNINIRFFFVPDRIISLEEGLSAGRNMVMLGALAGSDILPFEINT
jgi:Pyruvate/2-oxoacid:ferredoxin oxidoreductase gamma subunit